MGMVFRKMYTMPVPAGAEIVERNGQRIARWRLKKQTLQRRWRFNRGLPARKEELIRPAMFRECVS